MNENLNTNPVANFFADDAPETMVEQAIAAPAIINSVAILEATPRSLEQWIEQNAARIPRYVASKADLMLTAQGFGAITDDRSCTAALRCAGEIAAEVKAAKEHYAPYADAAHRLHKRVVGERDGIVKILQDEIDRLKRLALAYQQEQERKAREAARKAEEEARRKAEDERRRIEQEAQAEAERLAEQGRTEEAEAVIEQAALDVEDVIPEVVVPPAAAPLPASVTGASRRKTYKPQYGDLKALIEAAAKNPEAYAQYLSFNEKTIAAAVRAQGAACSIPGVSVVEEASLSVRASR